jgi:transposase
MLAELIDAVVGVDTHRDTHQVDIALPNAAPITLTTVSNDTTEAPRRVRRATGLSGRPR